MISIMKAVQKKIGCGATGVSRPRSNAPAHSMPLQFLHAREDKVPTYKTVINNFTVVKEKNKSIKETERVDDGKKERKKMRGSRQ